MYDYVFTADKASRLLAVVFNDYDSIGPLATKIVVEAVILVLGRSTGADVSLSENPHSSN